MICIKEYGIDISFMIEKGNRRGIGEYNGENLIIDKSI